MPTPDPTNVLFKIAHPDLYEHNPFNLLNLPVNATAKDIRRRREDLEAAFDAGTEADEFKSVLPLDENRKPPTREAVEDAFVALEDPETRMAYALFWFWPVNSADKYTNADINYWIESQSAQIEAGELAPLIPLRCHNLAVLHHMMALQHERSQRMPVDQVAEAIDGLEASGYSPEDLEAWLEASPSPSKFSAPDEVLKEWESAIRFWNKVTTDSDFWHSFADMVSALNDPRLDYRFARLLRDQFAFAFDQINVELAIDFAKAGRKADARRQVKYMRLSQPDADDVESTFDDAFSGLLRQTEAICKTTCAETDKNPRDGRHQAYLILEQTDEPLRVSRMVLEKGSPIRDAIVTTIFSAVRNCLIAYGNETADWDDCLNLCEKMKSIAETPEQERLVAEDVRIVARNKKEKDEQETCWFCKKKFSPDNLQMSKTVQIWGNMKKGERFGQVTFSKRDINVPICISCRGYNSCENHPLVKEWIDKGWKIGEGPTQEEIRDFLGLPNPKPQPLGFHDPLPQLHYGQGRFDQLWGLLFIIGAIFLVALIIDGCNAIFK